MEASRRIRSRTVPELVPRFDMREVEPCDLSRRKCQQIDSASKSLLSREDKQREIAERKTNVEHQSLHVAKARRHHGQGVGTFQAVGESTQVRQYGWTQGRGSGSWHRILRAGVVHGERADQIRSEELRFGGNRMSVVHHSTDCRKRSDLPKTGAQAGVMPGLSSALPTALRHSSVRILGHAP